MSKDSTNPSLSAKKVAASYTEKLKLAQNVETISECWVDTALTVHSRILSLKPCAELLDWVDTTYSNLTHHPFSKYRPSLIVGSLQKASPWP